MIASFRIAIVTWTVALVAILLAVVLVVDVGGAKPWNHRGPVPEGVTQLSETLYEIRADRIEQQVGLCQRRTGAFPDSAVDPVRLPSGDFTVSCARAQTWGERRAASPDLLGAAATTFGARWTWIVWLGGALLISIGIALEERSHRRRASSSENSDEGMRARLDRLREEGRIGEDVYEDVVGRRSPTPF